MDDVTPAERQLLATVLAGLVARPTQPISGRVIAKLCCTPAASGQPGPSIRVSHATIVGDVDLTGATVTRPVFLQDCEVRGVVLLVDAHTRTFNLDGTNVEEIVADGAVIEGELSLAHGFVATRGVKLRAANVRTLCCRGAWLRHPHRCLDGQGLVAASVDLSGGFTSSGEIFLRDARLTGSLDAEGAWFLNPGGRALVLTGAHVGGSVWLRNRMERGQLTAGFQAKGTIDLYDTSIEGDLRCDGATLEAPGGMALQASNLTVKGSMYLGASIADGRPVCAFRAAGQISCTNARISGNLDCQGAVLEHPQDVALRADAARVDGMVLLRAATSSDGAVLPFVAQGAVRFYAGQIGGDFDCQGATLRAEAGTALEMSHANIGGTVFLRGRADANSARLLAPFEANGRLNFFGVRIRGDLECQGGRLNGSASVSI